MAMYTYLIINCGRNDQNTKHRLKAIVYQTLQAIGGSITGEHGDGLEIKPWLYLSRNAEEPALMKTLKKLRPKRILNPGKFLPD